MTGTNGGTDAAPHAEAPFGDAEHGDGLSIGVRRGDPTPEELAALTAVVSDAYAREAADAVASDPPGMSAWAVSQRTLRMPLRRELGWSRSAW
ncbi:acyl-CoA carboxylase subunit epsilon [Microbacterium rhizomatis]|uniref:Acyl-CoA carboxylase subunit epsilon n=1 Tax=Microbacterium rhizomatis TaxID=1631477 RepID=A0A5J5J8B5_9MICO|nr:acyl-CoA carboxylase subunit epsilon [Microbacterium rhizomatis]KAA9111255.1 acyl-CoA carboxylase subunit epsilon [Microbacterium rhizomatis]